MFRPQIQVKHGEESLVSHSGLTLLGHLLDAADLKKRLPAIDIHCDQRMFTHADIAFAMMGQMSIGKPDYDAIELFRNNPEFFNHALGLSGCPSSVILPQRLQMLAQQSALDLLQEESASLVRRKTSAITRLTTSGGDLLTLDLDLSPMNNSKTHKEGVSRTCKGCDGYAPMVAYLGKEGYLVDLELREGSQHCQKGTPAFIRETLGHVRSITNEGILMRTDHQLTNPNEQDAEKTGRTRCILMKLGRAMSFSTPKPQKPCAGRPENEAETELQRQPSTIHLSPWR